MIAALPYFPPLKLPPDARSAAVLALLLCDSGCKAQEALNDVLGSFASALDKHDSSLCAELFYGVLRAEIRIAFLLGCVLPRPGRLPRPMTLILELAVYSLLFTGRVPDYAAIHCAVEHIHLLFGTKLAAVANGALRSLQRLGDAVSNPEFYRQSKFFPACGSNADALRWYALATFWSIPISIADLWKAAYGEDIAVMLMRRSSVRPWSALRVNAQHPDALKLLAAVLEGVPQDGVVSVGRFGVAFAPGAQPDEVLGKSFSVWRELGALTFQAAGSQDVLERLNLTSWQGAVWDCCAGYGGKSAALLECGVNVALCADTSLSRLRHLPEECRRLRLSLPHIVLADCSNPPVPSWDGHILLDVPCSGLGVLARRPDIRRAADRGLHVFSEIQDMLLARCSALLRSGRELAYITCTLNPLENKSAVSRLLEANADMQLVRSWQTPHDHPWMEGMYGAVLRKN